MRYLIALALIAALYVAALVRTIVAAVSAAITAWRDRRIRERDQADAAVTRIREQRSDLWTGGKAR